MGLYDTQMTPGWKDMGFMTQIRGGDMDVENTSEDPV